MTNEEVLIKIKEYIGRDKKIAHKEEAFSRLKKMIESVSNMRYIDI